MYFFKGIRLRDSLDYVACIQNSKSKTYEFTYDPLSMCSAHPIINIDKQYKQSNKQGILLNSELYTGSIAPLGSEYIYVIEKGNLIEKKLSKSIASTQVTKVINLQEASCDIETKEEKDNRVDEAELEDLLEEIFGEFYQKIPLHLKSLKKFKHIQSGETSYDILSYIKETISELLLKETNS